MKGVVFTGFLELVESKFGMEMVDEIINQCDLESKGVYTSVGTYSHKEMFQMVAKLSELKNIPVVDLLEIFGRYFFDVLSKSYPQFMDQPDMFSFFKSIDNYIHPEVLKLYPNAELPSFDSEVKSESEMVLKYSSVRKLSDFAVGLIYGAAEYYNESITIEKLGDENNGEIVYLSIKKNGK